jgi:hypothetical protein
MSVSNPFEYGYGSGANGINYMHGFGVSHFGVYKEEQL